MTDDKKKQLVDRFGRPITSETGKKLLLPGDTSFRDTMNALQKKVRPRPQRK